MFIHQWFILCHFVDINKSKIKFTNVSVMGMEGCTKRDDDKTAFKDSPWNVWQLCKCIEESNEKGEDVLF